MNRRSFLGGTTAGALALSASARAAGANDRVRVGAIGAGGRALQLIRTFASNKNVDLVAIADLDSRRLPAAVAEVQKRQNRKPWTTGDFRRIIDDKKIDALVVGTPDHWHAIPTILGCIAGKDVYVEKPDAHNIEEGMRMVAAMRRHRRIVQMGSQHRTTQRMITALEYIRSGALGRCLVAKAWESDRQRPIGRPADGKPPDGVDYDMWLGSAPLRPFNRNRFHGNWRWFYDYGTGDLGNDGVHRLDMAFAALNAACIAQKEEPLGLPAAVYTSGNKWYFDDAQEFPDTMQVNYEYHGKTPKLLTYEMRIWAPYRMEDETEGAAVYGDQGYIVLGNRRWRAFGPGGKLVREVSGDSHEGPHVQDFIDCIRSRRRPACDLETIGHPASILCHAGNISARLGGRKLIIDPRTETFGNDKEANALRGRREYRKPWVLPEVG
ncbi:MAG: Gfo/Idh/MocA family oxidoreductase [Planctomycetes bacterium]|nr:Gfo/Idh/MocA family oxidoreductase [Planctomycetota bacterium]